MTKGGKHDRPRSSSRSRKNEYLVCPTCPRSWVFVHKAGKTGWESCRECGRLWKDPARAIVTFDLGETEGGASLPLRSCLKGSGVGLDPILQVLLPNFNKAKVDGDQEGQTKLLAVCPDLEAAWKPPPEASPVERLAQKAQQLRQLQAQQGRIKNQLLQAAQTLKDMQTKLRTNIDECHSAQSEIDELVGKTKAAGPQSDARQAQQAHQEHEEDFPELETEELASLDEPTRKQYEEAAAAHKKARNLLKSATDAGKAAREAAERLRTLHNSIKRRRGAGGEAQGTDAAAAEPDETAAAATPEAVDFTDPSAIDQYIARGQPALHRRAPDSAIVNTKKERPTRMKSGYVDVLFANVTHYGEKVRHYVEHCSFDMLGLAEHHLLPKAAKQEIKKLRFKGWQSQFSWTPATPSMRSKPRHGSTLARWHGDSVFQKELRDISIILWRLKGATLALISVYLDCSVGLDGPANVAKMAQLTRVVKSLGVPWVALGDWNNTPTQMQQSPWLKALRGELLIPSDCTVTCSTGKGRLIDYGIASRDFHPFVKEFKPVRDVPWSPHVGLHLRLHSRPASVKVQMPIQPVKIEIATTTVHKEKGLKRAQRDREKYQKMVAAAAERDENAATPGDLHHDEYGHLLETTYATKQKETTSDEQRLQALADTRGRAVQDPVDDVAESWAYRLDPEGSNKLAYHFGEWSVAAEQSLCIMTDAKPKEKVRIGCNPKFTLRKVTIQEKTDPFLDAALREKANLWEASAARLRELAILKARQKKDEHLKLVENVMRSLSQRIELIDQAKGGKQDTDWDKEEDSRVLLNLTQYLAGQPCQSLRGPLGPKPPKKQRKIGVSGTEQEATEIVPPVATSSMGCEDDPYVHMDAEADEPTPTGPLYGVGDTMDLDGGKLDTYGSTDWGYIVPTGPLYGVGATSDEGSKHYDTLDAIYWDYAAPTGPLYGVGAKSVRECE
ncbi:unnamed protein product, partial [Prorocentrum cordatum]